MASLRWRRGNGFGLREQDRKESINCDTSPHSHPAAILTLLCLVRTCIRHKIVVFPVIFKDKHTFQILSWKYWHYLFIYLLKKQKLTYLSTCFSNMTWDSEECVTIRYTYIEFYSIYHFLHSHSQTEFSRELLYFMFSTSTSRLWLSLTRSSIIQLVVRNSSVIVRLHRM